MSERTPPPKSGRTHLVQQDIRVARADPTDPSARVVASVHCARRDCVLDVENCAACPQFARIEVHEAGYILVCREEEAPRHDSWPDVCSQCGDAETTSDHGSRNGDVSGSRGPNS